MEYYDVQAYRQGLENADHTQSYAMRDGKLLNTTLKTSDSKVGVVIIPSFATPREAYFKLASELPYNVLIFDPRGVSDSEGSYDAVKNIHDIEEIGAKWKQYGGIEKLVGVGHSIGGAGLAMTELDKCPYNLRILLAPPADPLKTQLQVAGYLGLLPKKLTPRVLWMYGKERRKNTERLGDSINDHYWSDSYSDFKKNPRFGAQRITDLREFVRQLELTPKLQNNTDLITPDTVFIYAGNDDVLEIDTRLSGRHLILSQNAEKMGAQILILDGLNHRFNAGYELEDIVQNDNTKLSEEIIRLITGSNAP